MIRHLLATSALAVALVGAAAAQEATETTEPLIKQPGTEQPMADEGANTAQEAEPVIEGEATIAEETAPMMEEEATTAQETPPAAPAEPLVQPMAPVADAPAAPMLVPVEIAEVTVEELVDAKLQNPDGDNLGSIEDALLDDGGNVETLVVSFGGFLGFGEKTVEVGLDEVELMKDEAGNVVAETSMTPESLEARPDYQEQPEA